MCLGADDRADNGFHGRFKIHARGVDDQVVVHDVGNVFMKCFADKCLAPLFTVPDPFFCFSQGNAISKRNISDADIQRGNDTDAESVLWRKNEIGPTPDNDASSNFSNDFNLLFEKTHVVTRVDVIFVHQRGDKILDTRRSVLLDVVQRPTFHGGSIGHRNKNILVEEREIQPFSDFLGNQAATASRLKTHGNDGNGGAFFQPGGRHVFFADSCCSAMKSSTDNAMVSIVIFLYLFVEGFYNALHGQNKDINTQACNVKYKDETKYIAITPVYGL